MALSFKLAGVFSLSLRWMLVAVFVCHVEERFELHRLGRRERELISCENKLLLFRMEPFWWLRPQSKSVGGLHLFAS